MSRYEKLRQAVPLLLLLLTSSWAGATLLNPGTPYLSFQDSPFWSGQQAGNFSGTNGYFFLEDFESGVLAAPGVSVVDAESTRYRVLTGSTGTDSVDADDGAIDGQGRFGHSFHIRPLDGDTTLATQVVFEFSETVLGNLPTHVGVVLTDGHPDNYDFTFDVFDGLENLFSSFNRPSDFDESRRGTSVQEDRFVGFVNQQTSSNPANGISKIVIRTTNGFELDHLQYGFLASPTSPPPSAVPEPSTLLLAMAALFGLTWARRRQA